MQNTKNYTRTIKQVDRQKALSRLQNLCARSEKCSGDLKQKMILWKMETTDISWVISRLTSDKFVDDARYAAMFVRDKSRISKWGRVKIATALRAKGISADVINEVLTQIDPSTDKAQLLELIARKAKQTKSKSVYDLKNKLIRFGVSHGFDMGLVIDVVNGMVKGD
ncbi:MAG TPA: regulatory protein RecX [Tenuifilaceae bacterium]|nr:regulatory protein RecX [Tenuifilaceae bacterium]HPI43772.1 regulatory protein RecX [Tenuifilaceae bacterium]HPN20599.1 regulatory protein RecX [Tenuifilaceae bacterium]